MPEVINLPTMEVDTPSDEGHGRTPAVARPTPRIATAGAKELITLEVNDELHTNWKSVRVEQRVAEAFPTFQFETTEESPVPLKVADLQFQPGDAVRVYVGGVPAVKGYITERHVAYDARQHAIRLIGRGDTADLVDSVVPLDNLEGHDGKSWTQLARDISAHLNIKIGEVGAVDNTPFQKIGIQPGETIMMVMERYARMRNIVIGSSSQGGLLAIGENAAGPSGDLVEGHNILRANAVIRDTHLYKRIFAVASDTGGSSGTGGAVAQEKHELPGTHSRNRHMVAVCEIADTMHGVVRRCHMERVFTEGTEIEANISVQGWFKENNQSNSVWKAGEYYFVNSPLLMLNGVVLGCAACMYEQNDGGSMTTLQMVKPEHMNGLLSYRNATQIFEQLRLQSQQSGSGGIGGRATE